MIYFPSLVYMPFHVTKANRNDKTESDASRDDWRQIKMKNRMVQQTKQSRKKAWTLN